MLLKTFHDFDRTRRRVKLRGTHRLDKVWVTLQASKGCGRTHFTLGGVFAKVVGSKLAMGPNFLFLIYPF